MSVQQSWLQSIELLTRLSCSTILSLSPECKRLLQILGCLPSRGIEVELLARLADLPSAYAARQRLGEATSIGIVTLRDDQVQFSHDRHHQGALDTLSTDDRARWCLELASHLDREGGDWEFLTADMLIFAREAGKFAFSDDELCSRSESCVNPRFGGHDADIGALPRSLSSDWRR